MAKVPDAVFVVQHSHESDGSDETILSGSLDREKGLKRPSNG